ncbi:MAG TPA: methylmalonyl Co-A mutase-associated GTPase MeaB [Miltoncostaeaceae bacterium]|nr:methylmalonyl Co-A mutase-associated GTPase MeaB [Miltoncostaeaceae bacterium]
MPPTPEDLARALRAGDRRALARAITLVESTRPDHREAADRLLRACLPAAGGAFRLAVSGPPGAGKSTLIETLGLMLVERGTRLAVLAVDPSSSVSGGSILGDKTRMGELVRHEHAYVRPTPAGTTLGGVARSTRDSIVLCEAHGAEVVIVETVGVGQSETAVSGMTDLFLLVASPAGGDDLQGIKRGIMELAVGEYRTALRLLQPRHPELPPLVTAVSARTGAGMAELWDELAARRRALASGGALARLRAQQARGWMWDEVRAEVLALLRGPRLADLTADLERRVAEGTLPPRAAAGEVVNALARQEAGGGEGA